MKRSFLSLTLLASLASTAFAENSPPVLNAADQAFSEAMALREEGKTQQAIQAFETILSKNPQLHRVKLELAVAHFRNSNFAKAESLAQEVLNEPAAPETVKVTVRQFIEQVKNAGKPSTLTPFVSVGVISNSNVSTGPSGSLFNINGQTYNLTDNQTKNADTGVTALVGVNHRYRFDKHFTFAGADSFALWETQAAYSHTGYSSKTDFNQGVAILKTGPLLISSANYRLTLPYQVYDMRLGSNHFATIQSLTPEWIYSAGSHEITADVQLLKKKYHQSADQDRNSNGHSAGLSFTQYFQQKTYSAGVSVRGFKENANQGYFSNHGQEAGVKFTAKATENLTLSLEQKYIGKTFSELHPTYGVTRKERLLTTEFGVVYAIHGGALDKWNVTLSASKNNNFSNVGFYEYVRTQTNLNLSRSF